MTVELVLSLYTAWKLSLRTCMLVFQSSGLAEIAKSVSAARDAFYFTREDS